MSSHDIVNQLKHIKIPLWANLVGRYRAWQRRRQAKKEIHHIATAFTWMYWTDSKYLSKRWYILKQRGDGTRLFEFGSNDSLLDDYKKDSEYARVIVPWLHGKYSNESMKEYAKKSERAPEVRAE